MKILITGGCGFIGSNFIHYLLKKYPSYKIINLDKLTYAGNPENLKSLENNPLEINLNSQNNPNNQINPNSKINENNDNYQFVKGDICNQRLVNKLVKDVDMIVIFAAESHVDRSIKNSKDFIKTNVLGTHVLLEAARRNGNKRFHHVSTDEVYGSLELEEDRKFHEKTIYCPRSPYSASKASADHLVNAYFHTYKLPVTISNCSNNYGPYQYPEKLIPLFITNLLEGKKVPVYGNGLNVRDWLYVEDHCEAIDKIIHHGKIGETYCIGGNCEIKNIELTKTILQKMNLDDSRIEFVEDRKGHDLRYSIDHSKIKKELGWEPKHNFEEGLQETINWYKENESWWKKLKQKK